MNKGWSFGACLLAACLSAGTAQSQSLEEVRYQAQETVRYIDNMKAALGELQPGDLSPENMAAFQGHMAEMTRAADQLRAVLQNPNRPAAVPVQPPQGGGQAFPTPDSGGGSASHTEDCDDSIPGYCDLPFAPTQ